MEPPHFCPFCGSPLGFEAHEHEPRFAALVREARARGEELPPLPARVEEILAGASFVGACPGCRTVSHVIGHRTRS